MPEQWPGSEVTRGNDAWPGEEIRATPRDPETFPSPGETAGRMAKSAMGTALGSGQDWRTFLSNPDPDTLPGMIPAMARGAVAPFTAPLAEIAAYARGKNSPTMDQIRQTVGKVREGDYLGAVPLAGPLVQSVVRGGQEIAAPAATAIVSGPNAITPEQMNTAADTGGAAIANLAAPEIARGGVLAAGKIAPGMGKLLKFAPGAAAVVSGHPGVALKMAVSAAADGLLEKLGTPIIDHVLDRIAARDANGAAAALAKGLERNPEVAQQFAAAMEAKANSVAPPGFRPIGNSPAEVAQRNALKQANRPPAPEAPQSTLRSPAFVDEARSQQAYDRSSAGYGRGATVNPGPWEAVDPLPEPVRTPQMPVPGNVKPATVFTKPGTKMKPPPGASESAKALAERQKGIADADAIRAAFGETQRALTTETPRTSAQAQRIANLAEKQRGVASEDAIRAAFEGPAESAPIKFHADPAIDAQIKESLPVIADALRKGKGTAHGYIETGPHSGDLKPYGPTDTGVKAALGLDDMPQSRKAIAEAIKRDKGNPIERQVAKRIAAQIEERADAVPFDVEPLIPHGKKGPSGAPLTAAERKAALIKLQESIASGEDIFASFGIEQPAMVAEAPSTTAIAPTFQKVGGKGPYKDWVSPPVMNPAKPWQERYAVMGFEGTNHYLLADRMTGETIGEFSARGAGEAEAAKLFGKLKGN